MNVNLSKRRAAGESAEAEMLVADPPEHEVKAGKNAPTPRRNHARAARKQQLKGKPLTSKQKSARVREIRAETMEALKSTDPAKLPANERVPELVYARDQIDTRRNLGSSILPVMIVYFVGVSVAGSLKAHGLSSSILLLSLFWFLGIGVDTYVASVKIERRVRERWPDSTQKIKWYAGRRALTPKRWRRPVVRTAPPQNRWDAAGR